MAEHLANRAYAVGGQDLAALFSAGPQDAFEHAFLGWDAAIEARTRV
jgi:hypothetical protein